MQMTLLGIVAVLLVIWIWLKRRRDAARDAAEVVARPKEDTTYHAVSIKFSGGACAAAKGMTGRRFLANAAPRLPLPECDVASCECRFVHHKDRRRGSDRRSPFSQGGPTGGGTGRHETERRERPDRRKNADTDLY